MLLDVWIVSMKWSAPTRKITARTLACAVAVAKSSILYSKSKELNFILKMLEPATISNKGLQIASVRAVAVGKKQRV